MIMLVGVCQNATSAVAHWLGMPADSNLASWFIIIIKAADNVPFVG